MRNRKVAQLFAAIVTLAILVVGLVGFRGLVEKSQDGRQQGDATTEQATIDSTPGLLDIESSSANADQGLSVSSSTTLVRPSNDSAVSVVQKSDPVSGAEAAATSTESGAALSSESSSGTEEDSTGSKATRRDAVAASAEKTTADPAPKVTTPPDQKPALTAPTTAATSTTARPVTVPADPDGAGGATRARTQSDKMPAAATSGTPLVKQIRDGVVIATYDSIGRGADGDGPFGRSHTWNKLQPGDVLEVYPAVYTGPGQIPWIGPLPNDKDDYTNKIFHRPTNITIRGVTVNGKRPVLKMGKVADSNTLGHGVVEIDGVDGLVWENIDVDGADGDIVDRAAIYIVESKNVTIRNSRVHGMQSTQHNGIFGAAGNSGTIHLDNVRLFDNGGWNGPAHNVYINDSDVDPNFTLKVTNSWSSAVNVGHLLKSRAQVTIVENSLLEGTNPFPGWDCAESFGLDVPNGGRVTVNNTVFIKAKPGSCANGMAFRYGAEGMDSKRANSVSLRNNTFIATSTEWDDVGHRNIPLGFYYPFLVPGSAEAPSVPITVTGNRFEGFRTADRGSVENYRGANFVDIPG